MLHGTITGTVRIIGKNILFELRMTCFGDGIKAGYNAQKANLHKQALYFLHLQKSSYSLV